MNRIVHLVAGACWALALALGSHAGAAAQTKESKCSNCGRVEQIRAVDQSDWKKYAAPAAGAVVGGVVGNQFGGGTGRTVMTVVGAVGGGMAGHKVEEKTRDKTWDVIVKMDDGTRRTVTYKSEPPVREGERVRLRDGKLVLVE